MCFCFVGNYPANWYRLRSILITTKASWMTTSITYQYADDDITVLLNHNCHKPIYKLGIARSEPHTLRSVGEHAAVAPICCYSEYTYTILYVLHKMCYTHGYSYLWTRNIVGVTRSSSGALTTSKSLRVTWINRLYDTTESLWPVHDCHWENYDYKSRLQYFCDDWIL